MILVINIVLQKYYINDKDDKKNIFTLIEKIAYEQRRFANIENVIPDNYYEVANLGCRKRFQK